VGDVPPGRPRPDDTFEHQVWNRTLRVIFPAVIALIALIVYLTHGSWVDALLMMTSVL
jgi:Cu(I)/Ag(I) efflux system membrane protein CusA/SilA